MSETCLMSIEAFLLGGNDKTYNNFNVRFKLRQLGSETLCQGSQSKLAGNVSWGHGAITSDGYLQPTNIIDVHDDTIVDPWMRNSQSKEVHVEYFLPVFHFTTLHCDIHVNGSIVDEDIYGAQVLLNPFQDTQNVILIGEIALKWEQFAWLGFQFLCECLVKESAIKLKNDSKFFHGQRMMN